MQLAFRKLAAGLAPGPGELLIRARRQQYGDCRALASLVIEHGAGALEQGEGPPERIVVSADPTLDDLLAVLLVQRRLAGDKIPAGFEAFARYAALVREGLRPCDVPLEVSLEGIFQAVRREAGADLNDPDARQRFLAGWSRITSRIVPAAEAGEDPFTSALFGTGHEFARERAYLAGDREVYRQDMARGERWRVRLPEAAPGYGLLLRRPASLLFKHWSRSPGAAPDGGPYLFLAVDWGTGEWIFSTDPLLRLSLRPLAELLQKSEAECDPERARANGWFDGAPWRHTLIAAPHGGTRLAEEGVLGIVGRWVGAEPLERPARRRGKLLRLGGWKTAVGALAGAAAVLVFAVVVLARHARPAPQRSTGYEVTAVSVNGHPEARARGFQRDGDPVEEPLTLREGWNNELEASVRLEPGAERRPVKLWITLAGAAAPPVDEVKLSVNGGEEHESKAVSRPDHTVRTDECEAVLEPDADNTVRLRLHSTSREPLPAMLHLNWRGSRPSSTLYVLAVGISQYRQPGLSLDWCDKDARDLAAAFKKQEGATFARVVPQVLPEGKATKSGILGALRQLIDAGAQDGIGESDVVILVLAGHGDVRDGEFYFLPQNFDGGEEYENTAVSWHSLWLYLRQLPSRVVVVVDACHSGGITLNTLNQNVADEGERLPKRRGGLGVLAACLGDQGAHELDHWKHGLLSLSLLECLDGPPRGDPLYPQDLGRLLDVDAGVVTLEDVNHYAIKRIKRLMGDRQEPVWIPSGGLSAESIAIAARAGAQAGTQQSGQP